MNYARTFLLARSRLGDPRYLWIDWQAELMPHGSMLCMLEFVDRSDDGMEASAQAFAQCIAHVLCSSLQSLAFQLLIEIANTS